MKIIYNLGIILFFVGLVLASIFSKKARLFLTGRKNLFKSIQDRINPNENLIWFHCASLGEFEQGRPVIESIKEKKSDQKILLTFFSPSGYEIRKNYEKADYIFYLPIDTKRNAEKFISLVNPKMAVFVKYEFWYHYLKVLSGEKIPVYLISSNFRANQIFFKWYGGFFRRILRFFSYLFVQNQFSKELLSAIQIEQVTVAGDTRFDRVNTIAEQRRKLPEIESFKNNKFTTVAGSTWKEDEEMLIRLINESGNDTKWIVVPHEIHENHITWIVRSFKKPVIRYSEMIKRDNDVATVLIIDNIGMLSSLYYYGNLAFVGGGFGKGIHNILEAATYGIPVLFGSNYKAFQEAIDLVKLGGAFSVKSYEELMNIYQQLTNNPEHLKNTGNIARNYVESNLGATETIVKKLLID
jgi:3-deoxy-D-manno-octulosonic-acid transferase